MWDEADALCRDALGFSLLTVVRENPVEMRVGVEVLRHEGWPVVHADWMRADEAEQETLFDAQEVDGRPDAARQRPPARRRPPAPGPCRAGIRS